MKHEILAPGIEIYCADCMDVMRDMPDKGVDFVWTDPPYNVGKVYDNHNDSMDEIDYMQWVYEWMAEIVRVSNTFAIYPPKTKLKKYWDIIPDQRLLICAWSPSGAIQGGFIHQFIPLLVPEKPLTMVKDHWWNVQVPGMGYFYREKKYDHPGQTSLDITERIIKAFTLPGQTVLDPFGGTGTTAEACIKLERRCILIDKSPNYYEIAKRRILEVLAQPRLFDIPAQDEEVNQLSLTEEFDE